MTIQAVPFALIALIGVASVARPAFAQDDGPSYSIQDVTACSQDAMRLCKDKMPDIEAIEACMKVRFAELSPKCRARFSNR